MGQLPSICEQVRAYAAASVDGELSEVEAARLESHLSTCASCRHFAADLGEIAFLVRSTPLESLDFPIVLPSTRLRLGRVFQVGAAAAAVAAVVGISATVGIGQRPTSAPRDRSEWTFRTRPRPTLTDSITLSDKWKSGRTLTEPPFGAADWRVRVPPPWAQIRVICARPQSRRSMARADSEAA